MTMIGGLPLTDLRDLYRRLLFDEFIPFWHAHGIDRELGGFLSAVPGQPAPDLKTGWDQGRGIWTFAHLYNHHDRDPRHLEAAQRARAFTLRHGRDERGDWVNGLTREGRVTAGAVSVYTDIYMAHGLTELFRADGDPEGLRVAVQTARRIAERIAAPDFRHSLSVYARPHRVNAVWFFYLSALTDLLQVSPDEGLEGQAEMCVRHTLERHLDPRTGLFIELLAPDFSRLDDDQGHEVMPGHSAQACWMLMEEARRKKDRALFRQAVEILRRHVEAGWDPEYGGVFYLIDDRDLRVVDPAKNAWQQEEFLVALMEVYEYTHLPWASEWYGRAHRWAFEKLTDHDHGQWHTLADRQGRPPAAPARKDLYHYPRMLMRNLESLERQLCRDGKIVDPFA
jgi:mannose/cellobiose epimerase-like protein (N-acyl-D-glucosamine 2-epimerase family)